MTTSSGTRAPWASGDATLRDPMWSDARDVEDIPAGFRAEIEQFFRIYKELEHLPTRTSGFGEPRGGAAAARCGASAYGGGARDGVKAVVGTEASEGASVGDGRWRPSCSTPLLTLTSSFSAHAGAP